MTANDDSWRHLAGCRGVTTALFFPDFVRTDPTVVAEAKAVCGSCPVRQRCVTVGLSEADGIWGGVTVTEGRAARQAHQREAA